jgi:hypothetical protein
MAGIFDRITSLAGTEAAKAINLAHGHYQSRMGEHGHTGRALIETVAEVCRNHPNLVGIGVGLMVEQLLVEEKHRHDAHLHAETAPATTAVVPYDPETAPFQIRSETIAPTPVPIRSPFAGIRVHDIRPIHIAFEVFGGLILLKVGAVVAHMFRRKSRHEVWFAPAAKIHLFSASLAAYNIASAIKSPRVSASRNAAIFFFGTDAIKPLLKTPKRRALRASAA